MSMSYATALEKLLQLNQTRQSPTTEDVDLSDSLGRIASFTLKSPKYIPEFDNSAMDGYAISSEATINASHEKPAIFQVCGTVAAGDDPGKGSKFGQSEIEPCMEIMTGGIFPPMFDACVKVEDTVAASIYAGRQGRFIFVSEPVAKNANRRFAGSDIQKDHAIIRFGDRVQLSHIMPLAAVGYETIPVVRKPAVGVFSTGRELKNIKCAIKDINGPFLVSSLREMNIGAQFLGTLDDEPLSLKHNLQKHIDLSRYDVMITSGAVSVGKFDFIRTVLDSMGAEVIFHGLAIRPGHPVLFALVPSADGRKTAFFGLPGNPGATAACFRFLVVPYLRWMQRQITEAPIPAILKPRNFYIKQDTIFNQRLDCFRHGILQSTSEGVLTVTLDEDQSPAKLAPFIHANCWAHLKRGHEYQEESVVDCYLISTSGVQIAEPL